MGVCQFVRTKLTALCTSENWPQYLKLSPPLSLLGTQIPDCFGSGHWKNVFSTCSFFSTPPPSSNCLWRFLTKRQLLGFHFWRKHTYHPDLPTWGVWGLLAELFIISFSTISRFFSPSLPQSSTYWNILLLNKSSRESYEVKGQPGTVTGAAWAWRWLRGCPRPPPTPSAQHIPDHCLRKQDRAWGGEGAEVQEPLPLYFYSWDSWIDHLPSQGNKHSIPNIHK